AARRRRLPCQIASPARHAAIGRDGTRMVLTGGEIDKRPGRRLGLSERVVSPTDSIACRSQTARVTTADRNFLEGARDGAGIGRGSAHHCQERGEGEGTTTVRAGK